MNSSSYLQPMGIIYLHQGSGHEAATFMSENSVLFYSYNFYFSLYSVSSKAEMSSFKIKHMYQNMLWERFRNALKKET